MAEAGGTSTQAGIYYQNSIAALHMGRMLDVRPRAIGDRVTSVRVEAPGAVDDIVVRHADGTTKYIQAKLSLRRGGNAWDRLWTALAAQREKITDLDRLTVVLGEPSVLASALRDCARRTDSSDAAEWRSRLTDEQKEVIDAVKTVIGSDDAGALRIFAAIDVEVISENTVERDYAPLWMPAVEDPTRFLGYLRDTAGGGARTRALFEPARLRTELHRLHGVDIADPPGWGADLYRHSLANLLRITVPGTSIVRSLEDGFIWPFATKPDNGRRRDFDDDWGRWLLGVEPEGIDLSAFPSAELDKLIIVAGPGFGKSTLLTALASRALAAGLLPAIVSASELSSSDLEIAEHLQVKVNAAFDVSIDWRLAGSAGLAVLLIDGLDEIGAGRRSVILERLRRYSVINPSTRWVLTVRDAAALSAPTEAMLLELSPLSDSAVRQFVAAYLPVDDGIQQRLTSLFESQPEMRRLARIPLFLAMLLATAGKTGRLPTSRTDLIEDYLALLWNPADFKCSDGIETDPLVMRELAQRAAFEALERDQIGVEQRLLERMLPAQPQGLSSRTVIGDMMKCGVLRRPEPSRYEFPFPIIQEYLAGCHLVENRAGDIPRKLASVAKRPWAQAMQFALERHPDPVSIVDTLMDDPDDAFDTHIRLLGRCVANGMTVTPEQRSAITRRLLALWDPDTYWKAQAIGNLIADGFARPLIPELREKLFDRNLRYSGAGRILCDLADDQLSLEVLHGFVTEEVDSVLNLTDFQPEVDRIGGRAFRLYINAGRAWSDSDEGVRGVAALINHLSGANVEQADICAAIVDETLPITIRAAALSLARPIEAIAGAAEIARMTLEGGGWNAPDVAARAALHSNVQADELVRWAMACEAGDGPVFIGKVILRCGREGRPELIEAIVSDGSLGGRVRNHALVFAMSVGHQGAFDDLLGRFGSLDREVVTATCALIGHFPTVTAAERIRVALEARDWDATDRRSISSGLQTGLCGALEMSSFSSGSIAVTQIHPGMSVLVPLLERWEAKTDYEPCDALRMTLDLVRLGQDDAVANVHQRLQAALAVPPSAKHLHFDDHVIGNAVEILHDRRQPLSLSELEEIARTRTFNARSSAVKAIARQGTTEACDSLISLYADLRDASSRDSLMNALQTLASQLGLKVTLVGNVLTASAA